MNGATGNGSGGHFHFLGGKLLHRQDFALCGMAVVDTNNTPVQENI